MQVRWLFIAEAPPGRDNDGFFYSEQVPRHDRLFTSLVRVLYPREYAILTAGILRSAKPAILARFKEDGCFLEEACAQPVVGRAERQLALELPALLERLEPFRSHGPRVVLIKKSVFDTCLRPLRERGWNVINDGFLPFPSSRHQRRFQAELAALLDRHGWPGRRLRRQA